MKWVATKFMLSLKTAGGDNFQSHIFKGGGGFKKMSAWGDLKSSRHVYLPGGLLYFLSKKRLKNKIWL